VHVQLLSVCICFRYIVTRRSLFATTHAHAHTHQLHDTKPIYCYHYDHGPVTTNALVAVRWLAGLDLLAVLQKLRKIP
jgi:hypothetical protein